MTIKRKPRSGVAVAAQHRKAGPHEDKRRKRRRIVASEDVLGGEPVFEGTRASVRRIVALLKRGETVESILEDYPYLTEKDLVSLSDDARPSSECTNPPKKSQPQ